MGEAFVGYAVEAGDDRYRLYLDDDLTEYLEFTESDIARSEWVEPEGPGFARLSVELAEAASPEKHQTSAEQVLAELELGGPEEDIQPLGLTPLDPTPKPGITRGPVCGTLSRHPVCFMTVNVCVPVSGALGCYPTAGECVPAPHTPRCATAQCPPTVGGGRCDPASRGVICQL